MISFTKLNAITSALIVVLAALMTSKSSGHAIGWKTPPQKDGRNVLARLRKQRDVNSRADDYVTECFSSADSFGGAIGSSIGSPMDSCEETPSCVEPSIDDLRRCVDTVENDAEVIRSESELENELVDRYNFTIYATEPTPTTVTVDLAAGEHALNERTLCPWTYKTNSDINRYPADIQYAQCQCHSCRHELPNKKCLPVVSWKPVLMKGACVNGTYQYTEEKIPVPVACVCARPNEE